MLTQYPNHLASSSLSRFRRSAGPSPNKQIGSLSWRRFFFTSMSSVLTLINRARRFLSNSSNNAALSFALKMNTFRMFCRTEYSQKTFDYISCSAKSRYSLEILILPPALGAMVELFVTAAIAGFLLSGS